MDKIELFSVSVKKDGTKCVEMNNDIIECYGISEEEIPEFLDKDKLNEVIIDFCSKLNSLTEEEIEERRVKLREKQDDGTRYFMDDAMNIINKRLEE